MLYIKTYGRKEYTVDGVQVTLENMHDVARWCGGEVFLEEIKDIPTPFVKVPVHRPLNEKQTKAYVASYVLQSPTGFKVYTERAMEKNFEEQGGDTMVDLGDVISYDEPGNLFDRAPEKKYDPVGDVVPEDYPTTSEELGFDAIKEPFGSRKQV